MDKPKPCERCVALEHENVVLRDAVEALASRVAEASGVRPHSIRRGFPAWISFVPESARKLWARSAGGGRGAGTGR